MTDEDTLERAQRLERRRPAMSLGREEKRQAAVVVDARRRFGDEPARLGVEPRRLGLRLGRLGLRAGTCLLGSGCFCAGRLLFGPGSLSVGGRCGLAGADGFCFGTVRLLPGGAALVERDHGARDRPCQRDRHDCESDLESPVLPESVPGPFLFSVLLGVSVVAAGVEELALQGVRVARVLGAPGQGVLEAGAAVELARLALEPLPGARWLGEVPKQTQSVTVVVDPAAQPQPLAQQRLVGDLDGRAPRERVTVEREQPMAPEAIDHLLDRVPGNVDRLDLGAHDPPAGVLGPLPEADKAREQAPRRVFPWIVEAGVELIGARCQRASHPADLLVGVLGERGVFAALIQLAEGVLQKRQRARLVDDVGDDVRDQPRLQLQARAPGRARDRCLKLPGAQRMHRDMAVLDQRAEPSHTQRPVIEIRAQRHHHTHTSVSRRHGVGQQLDEASSAGLVREGEQLLELVDHHQQLPAPLAKPHPRLRQR